jgi:ribosomal protein S18 acetylase RimI-like enzyme
MVDEIIESWKSYLEEVEMSDITIYGIDSEEYIQDWEEEEVEEVEDYVPVVDQAYKITTIRTSKDLAYVAVDLMDNNKVYGAAYFSRHGNNYSFDIEVHPDARRMGVAGKLIDACIELYKQDYDIFYDSGYDSELPKLEVHVVNEKLVNHLKNKGFKVVSTSPNHDEWWMKYVEDRK